VENALTHRSMLRFPLSNRIIVAVAIGNL